MQRVIVTILLSVTLAWSAEAPFKRGVNLTNWFQVGSAPQIQFSKFTRQDFVNIKRLGCDVIRFPVNLHYMTDGAPNYTIDPLFFYFFDQVLDWAEELELHLILDNHTFDPAADTDPNIGDILVPVWTQIAAHYQHRSRYLYYEILNEPHGISDAKWNAIQQKAIDAIRAIDQKHTIIVGPAGWNSYQNLKYMPVYSDPNLIYTFHFYDPFLFTHQGASWTDPSMVPLTGVPFPYHAARLPVCPPALRNTWIEGSLADYKNVGTISKVRELIDIAVNFGAQRNVPLFCGEFGVYIPNSPPIDRVLWYYIVRSYLEEKGIAWTIWDYTGGFGIFEADTPELFDFDLNVSLLSALGFNLPPQQEYVLKPDSIGFDLYLDFIGPNLIEASSAGRGIIEYYSAAAPVRGKYCIYCTEVDQYNHIGFKFKPIKDLAGLVNRGYALDFWVRGDTPGAKLDLRFIDTKTSTPADHPWRMRTTLDRTKVAWDGAWHHLQIPLTSFTEHGSWDNGWFNPQGDFDWKAVEYFQIVAEHHALKGMKFWFDQMRIVDPRVTGVASSRPTPLDFTLFQNYPNPFNAQTRIQYQVLTPALVEVFIFNLVGEQIRRL
ncbi:glycoside hydrolase family 5 protein, partial [candidate division KSB1 bacterium]|nr:glycoside hydrolase family 5 protein [candidate division KSB1 bacterium]